MSRVDEMMEGRAAAAATGRYIEAEEEGTISWGKECVRYARPTVTP